MFADDVFIVAADWTVGATHDVEDGPAPIVFIGMAMLYVIADLAAPRVACGPGAVLIAGADPVHITSADVLPT